MEDAAPKRCYYEVLNVEIKASDDDIKRSFKKLSLKNHPDKNRHRQDEAKAAFQEITEAYNTLSDPKQREWYDKNREKILMKKSDLSKEELQEQSYGFDIFAHFDESAWENFDDSEGGFYAVYRTACETLDNEEAEAHKFKAGKGVEYNKLPSFGNSKTAVEDIVKFYDTWQNFSTIKVFAWADSHDARDGESRYEKRQMEQENERERRKEKKKYVATVRDLITFIKKNDPRREQLIELAKQEELKKEAARELNKGSKQKKREQQKREEEERKKKKEEELERKFQEQEKQRLQLLEEQKKEEEALKAKKASEAKAAKLGNQKKAKQAGESTKTETEQIVVTLDMDPTKLTKKQLKQYTKLQAQAKAAENKKAQEKKEQQKKKEEQNNDEEEQEESKPQQPEGGKKKRIRKKKNKKAAEDQEEEKEEQ